MEQRGTQGMLGRYALFVVLSLTILMINVFLMSIINPQKPQGPAAPEAAPAAVAEQQPVPANGEEPADALAEQRPAEAIAAAEEPSAIQQPAAEAAEMPAIPEQPEIPPDWVTLGSIDPADPYRMLVTLSNEGAALVRVELSSRRYRNQEQRMGYLGHVVGDPMAADSAGCPVQIVGPGTPAAAAGLKKGDLIAAVDGQKVTGDLSLARALRDTEPGQGVELTVIRQSDELRLPVTLGRAPLEVVRPEGADPLSLLFTLAELDEKGLEKLVDEFRRKEGDAEQEAAGKDGIVSQDETIHLELEGVNLRHGTWEIASHNQEEAVFRRLLPACGLEIVKKFRLARVEPEALDDDSAKAYHLGLDIEIRNLGTQSRKVAYQLDGPTGLPIEGYWYASKIGREWGAVGLRDVAVFFSGWKVPKLIPCPDIAADDVGPAWRDESLAYIGVDAQYFSAVLMPQKRNPEEIWFARSQPLRVGPVNVEWKNTTNTSFRLTSLAHDLEPGGSLSHSFTVFAGPKKPKLLDNYGLGELVYYGWFGWVAKPMLSLLHGFYAVFSNYGLAIIMLTVLVRSAMFPLSKKQALGAQKMAALQPEIKKIHEKYKNDFEARNKAQQELFRKHNYNPLSGCLVQAPLITESIRWCSDLSAPDMLFNWSGFMPQFVTEGHGFFGLGPYFNLLPLLTIVFFIVQQKMLMPPPADEQAAMQQNVMKFMMIFMGILFFKVASGLCIYFIASSLWGLAERKLLPKHAAAHAGDRETSQAASPPARRDAAAQKRRAEGDGAAGKRRKQSRGRK